MTGRPHDDDIAKADIVVSADVEADDLEVTVAPDPRVEFHGEEEAGAGTNRENLPDHVTEGERYRAVRIHYALAARAARQVEVRRRRQGAAG
ncbi:hypothetical protein [Herbidospora cretacea]|uniref:hypothetical protein n=1 Tax=Herbidospora cretacea TaxID=28444 RepID=UPI0007738454|nr:hypothetical protein [Herbidospora cretacea]